MDHFSHVELIRIHQADLRAAADHHRLVREARRAGQPARPRVPTVRRSLGRVLQRQVRALRASGP